MSRVALVIIFNHQYDRNIPILEKLYGDRFSSIFFLVPFYTGQQANVIAVYENSFYFQNYVAQGLKSFWRPEFEHYLFLGDDLILNPAIDEHNYAEHFALKRNTCFVSGFVTLHKRTAWWPRVGEAYRWTPRVSGVEITNQLPTVAEANVRFDRCGLSRGPARFSQLNEPPRDRGLAGLWRSAQFLLRRTVAAVRGTRYEAAYPFVGSYSDLFVVSADAIKSFCHYCGVFAATRLFVEVAVPTAMVLAAEEIVTENDLALKGKALWIDGQARLDEVGEIVKDDLKELDRYGSRLDRLLAEFPAGYLYLHPIKLSKWSS